MKNILLSSLFILLFSHTPGFSQTEEISTKRNFAFLEVGGIGLFASLNYERQVSKVPGFSLRGGIGFYTEDDLYVK